MKKITKRLALASMLFLGSLTVTNAQDEWTLISEECAAKISYQVVDCPTGKAVLVQIENANDFDLNMILDLFITIDGQRFDQLGKMIRVAAISVAEGDCQNLNNQLTITLPFPGENVTVEANCSSN